MIRLKQQKVWYNFRTKLRYNISVKSIEKWARHKVSPKGTDQIVIYGNPCTMQIIIEHWDDVVLGSHKKNKNAPIIFALAGVEGYKGRADQRQVLFSQITRENYREMWERIKKLPSDDTNRRKH